MTSRTSPAITELYQRFSNGAKLLAEFTPDTQVIYCRDVDKCHFGKAPTIRLVEKAYGRKTAMSWMEIQLYNLSEFAGCKEKLSPTQIAETAAMILDGYPCYKLTEFMLFFQRFKRCEYGKFYGAVDPMVILQALSTFSEERVLAITKRQQAEQKEKQKKQDAELDEIRERYRRRVPDAFTDKAPIDFLQYRLMGFDCMDDERLAKELETIVSGEKKLPTDVMEMIRHSYNIND